jgi:hydroxyacylglutathione hydrolase
VPPALSPAAFRTAIDCGEHVLLDTRHMLAFGGGHVPGAWNIGASGHLSIQAGWMLDPGRSLLLVLESDAQVQWVATHLARTGFDTLHGYLAGGMTAWENAGFELASVPQLQVRELAPRLGDWLVLDVRSPQEWEKGHVPGARHLFLGDLATGVATLDRGRRIAVYCDSGYRASIAASFLRARGYDVSNVPGSWEAWTACGLPVE